MTRYTQKRAVTRYPLKHLKKTKVIILDEQIKELSIENSELRQEVKRLQSENIDLSRLIMRQATEAARQDRRIYQLTDAIRQSFEYIRNQSNYCFNVADATFRRLIAALGIK